MINWLHLLWIIPVAVIIGYFVGAWHEWAAGYQAGIDYAETQYGQREGGTAMMEQFIADRAKQEAKHKRFSKLNADELEIVYRAFVYADTHWDEGDKDGAFQSLYGELKAAIMEVEQ